MKRSERLRRFGKSLGVILPQEVINRLHTKEGESPLLIDAPDGGCLLTHRIAMAGDIITRYRNTLRVLAK